jgi:hypothetical protein
MAELQNGMLAHTRLAIGKVVAVRRVRSAR